MGALRLMGALTLDGESPISPILPIFPIFPIFLILPIFPIVLIPKRTNLLLEGGKIQRSGNFGAMGCTQSTAHCYNNLLAAVDAPLSQQI